MSAIVTIYGLTISNYVRSVLICCEEKGIAYEQIDQPPHSEEINQLNPFGRIPVLRYKDLTLYESAAICRFIDRQFAGPSLSPDNMDAKARMDQWISIANVDLDPFIMRQCVIQYAFPSGPDESIDEDKIQSAIPVIEHHLAIIEQHLQTSHYLAAEQASIADFLVLPMMDYLAKVPPGEALLAAAPAVNQWLARMRQRPSAIKVLADGG